VRYSDLFPAGLGFDITGAYLLARGLITGPAEYSQRFLRSRHSFARFNVRAAEDFADGKAGVLALVTGFVLQAVAYVLSATGVASHTRGAGAGFIAGLCTVGAIAIAYELARATRWPWVRQWLVECAHWDEYQANRREAPNGQELMTYGQILGRTLPDEYRNPDSVRRHALRVWGTDRVWDPSQGRVLEDHSQSVPPGGAES
jgi:hypothetical protein